jgi:hypothetical protein
MEARIRVHGQNRFYEKKLAIQEGARMFPVESIKVRDTF